MTATRKLFIAALLLAAGFGVARLLGEPAARWYASQPGLVVPARNATIAVNSTHGEAPATQVVSNARLVPDFGAENPYAVRNDSGATAPATPPALPPDDFGSCQQLLASQNVSSAASNSPSLGANVTQRAKLRDEAPRPMEIESRAPSIVYPTPPAQGLSATGDANTPSAPSDWRANGLATANFVQDSPNVATVNASYKPAAEASGIAVSPPPWPMVSETSGPRTHIVIDGDSLERLAGRYLDDPRRGNEIYEANRELLASPDLLPIGAELVIPRPAGRAAFEGSSPQSAVVNDQALRAASYQGLVPVRPVAPAANILPAMPQMPRAQLMRPMPVE